MIEFCEKCETNLHNVSYLALDFRNNESLCDSYLYSHKVVLDHDIYNNKEDKSKRNYSKSSAKIPIGIIKDLLNFNNNYLILTVINIPAKSID